MYCYQQEKKLWVEESQVPVQASTEVLQPGHQITEFWNSTAVSKKPSAAGDKGACYELPNNGRKMGNI